MGRSYTRRSLIEYLFYPLACCRKGTLGHKFLWRVPGAKVRATGGYGKRSLTSARLLSHWSGYGAAATLLLTSLTDEVSGTVKLGYSLFCLASSGFILGL